MELPSWFHLLCDDVVGIIAHYLIPLPDTWSPLYNRSQVGRQEGELQMVEKIFLTQDQFNQRQAQLAHQFRASQVLAEITSRQPGAHFLHLLKNRLGVSLLEAETPDYDQLAQSLLRCQVRDNHAHDETTVLLFFGFTQKYAQLRAEFSAWYAQRPELLPHYRFWDNGIASLVYLPTVADSVLHYLVAHGHAHINDQTIRTRSTLPVFQYQQSEYSLPTKALTNASMSYHLSLFVKKWTTITPLDFYYYLTTTNFTRFPELGRVLLDKIDWTWSGVLPPELLANWSKVVSMAAVEHHGLLLEYLQRLQVRLRPAQMASLIHQHLNRRTFSSIWVSGLGPLQSFPLQPLADDAGLLIPLYRMWLLSNFNRATLYEHLTVLGRHRQAAEILSALRPLLQGLLADGKIRSTRWFRQQTLVTLDQN